DAVAARAAIDRAELVGLVPRAVLERTPVGRWAELDLAADRTIEARLAARGLDGTRRLAARRPPRSRPWPRPRRPPARADAGCGVARARSSRPRCRTSRRWPARTRGSPLAPRSHGRPPSPRAWTRHARGRTGPDPHPGSWRSPATTCRPRVQSLHP